MSLHIDDFKVPLQDKGHKKSSMSLYISLESQHIFTQLVFANNEKSKRCKCQRFP